MATAQDMAQPTTFGHVADCSNLKNKKRHLTALSVGIFRDSKSIARYTSPKAKYSGLLLFTKNKIFKQLSLFRCLS